MSGLKSDDILKQSYILTILEGNRMIDFRLMFNLAYAVYFLNVNISLTHGGKIILLKLFY